MQTRIEVDETSAFAKHSAWKRLENQLTWYDDTSKYCQYWYKGLKILQVSLAVLIPVMSLMEPECAKWATAISGTLIALIEAIQQLNQYSTLWLAYRATAEQLKREKHLFLSAAGPYRNLELGARLTQLAERVEEQISMEHKSWLVETKMAAGLSKAEAD